MATYVTLVNWTEQGVKGFRDTVQRAEAFEQLVQKHGGRVISTYWTLGPYDIVAVLEAPDDETYTAVALQVGSLGNVRTTSMRAYTAEEMSSIIAKTS